MFGERLRQLRQQQNLSQEELADRVGVHNNSVSKWENGVIPNMKRIITLAKILGTTATYLLGETDDPNPAAGNKSNSESVSTGDTTPYTQAQTVDRGMLIYDLGNGKKIELPPTKDSYDFLREIASRAAHVAVL